MLVGGDVFAAYLPHLCRPRRGQRGGCQSISYALADSPLELRSALKRYAGLTCGWVIGLFCKC